MKNIFTLTLLALATFCAAQSNQVKTPGVSYSAGAPNWVPVVKTASELAIDTTSKRMYLWNRNTGAWDLQGRGVDQTSGATPPAYTPGQTDSYLAVNNANPPELYAWSGSAWVKVGGVAYTAGTGIAISGSNVISNTGDLSNTNELQNLSLTGQALGITSGTGVTLPIIDVVAGTGVTVSKASGAATVNSSGITALTGDVTATGPGSAAATIANGAVNGAKLAANSVDSTKVTARSIAGSDIALATIAGVNIQANTIDSNRIRLLSIPNSDIANVAPEKLLQKGATSGQVLGWNGSVWGPSTITRGWDLTGNAATAGSSFLGTTNNTSLRFRTNNAQRIILDSLGNVGVGTNLPIERVHVVGSGYFTGDVRIGSSTVNATNLSMTRALTGATTVFAANLITTVQSDVLQGIGYASAMATQATPFSTIIRHFYAQQGTFGAGSNVTQQAGFFAASNLTGATENYGFHGTIPSGSGRWNAYMSGTANNALAGSTIIGATSTPAARLHVVGAGATSSTWTAQFHNSTGANNALMVRDDGNVGIGTNAPGARFHVIGNPSSSATYTAEFHNSTGTNNALRIRDDGRVISALGYYTGDATSLAGLFPNASYSNRGVILRGNLLTSDTGDDIVMENGQGHAANTSGLRNLFFTSRGFAPTSGTGEFRTFAIAPVINQTGGANGASIGFLAVPTLTSAFSWRSFEYRNNTGWGIYGVGTANNYIAGNTTIGSTNTPTDRLDITGANGYSQLRLRTAYTPPSTADTNGNTGDISWDENYFYVKTAAGWKRSALSTF